MEYRELGRTGLRVSAVGLGTEHLERSGSNMDAVFGLAVDSGVNYVDVLYEDAESEAPFWDSIAPALRRHRDSLVLAAHWGPSHWGDVKRCEQCFEDVLFRVGNDYAEVALMAVIEREPQWDEWGRRSAEALLRYKLEGRIGHLGLSSHYPETALRAARSGLIDVLMFEVNLLRHDYRPLEELLDTCREEGVGVVAMKPYFGGKLFGVRGKSTSITPSQCLQYVLSQPVSTTVPGARHADDLRGTLHYLEATPEERDYGAAIAGLTIDFEGVCTRCNHCLPCPEGLEVGNLMTLLDIWQGGGHEEEMRTWYAGFESKATDCTECGLCVERCAFGVDVLANMQRLAQLLGS